MKNEKDFQVIPKEEITHERKLLKQSEWLHRPHCHYMLNKHARQSVVMTKRFIHMNGFGGRVGLDDNDDEESREGKYNKKIGGSHLKSVSSDPLILIWSISYLVQGKMMVVPKINA